MSDPLYFKDFDARQLWTGITYDAAATEKTIIGFDGDGNAVGMNTSMLLPSHSVAQINLSTTNPTGVDFVPSADLRTGYGTSEPGTNGMNVEFYTDSASITADTFKTAGVITWTRRSLAEIAGQNVSIAPVDDDDAQNFNWKANEWVYYRTTDVADPVDPTGSSAEAYEGAHSRPLAVRTIVPSMTNDTTPPELKNFIEGTSIEFKLKLNLSTEDAERLLTLTPYFRLNGEAETTPFIKGATLSGAGISHNAIVRFTFTEDIPTNFAEFPEVEVIWVYKTTPQKVVINFSDADPKVLLDDLQAPGDFVTLPDVTVTSVSEKFLLLNPISLNIVSTLIGNVDDVEDNALVRVTVDDKPFLPIG